VNQGMQSQESELHGIIERSHYHHVTDLQQLVGEISWGHNILIMQQVKDESARRYYLEATARLGWTRNVLLNQIKGSTYEMIMSGLMMISLLALSCAL
jgi:predicted nuclease of restriction endonuclease-like (RecB) superfamily